MGPTAYVRVHSESPRSNCLRNVKNFVVRTNVRSLIDIQHLRINSNVVPQFRFDLLELKLGEVEVFKISIT